MRRIFAFILVLLGASAVHAQSVRWEPADSGDPSELQLVFDECAPNGDPRLPAVDGLTLTLTGNSRQTNIINGSISQLVVLTYRARSRQTGPIQIPAFTIQTDKGPLKVAAYSGGSAGVASDLGTSSTLAAPTATFWAGEVFPLTYTLSVPRRYFNQLGSDIEWSASPLIVEEWSKPEPGRASANGDAADILYKTRAYAKTPGRVTLNAVQQLVNLQTGSSSFGFFQQPRIEQISVTSNRPDFTIRPLPAGAPATFNGAVGQFTLASKVVPATAAVGEPVTWTLTLAGTGNWPDIPGLPAREVSRDFQVVQPQAKRSPAEGKVFDATLTEDVVLIPSRPGTYTLGPVAYTCFDPQSGTYKTLTGEKFTVTVTAPPAPQITLKVPASDTPARPDETAVAPAKPPATPALPAPIPRDPLPGSGHALVPVALPTLILRALAPFAVPLVIWFGLALGRAARTDPLRPRREAYRRLVATLAALRKGGDAGVRTRLLLAWQHDAAVLWQIDHAAPSAAAFADRGATAANPWQILWTEADRALYGPGESLPTDWIDRAETALASKRVSSFSPFQLFLARNLLPFAAALTIGAWMVTTAFAQEKSPAPDPLTAYRGGDFSSAAQTWRETLSANPTDWIARHNLSLALVQLDHPGEGAAQAAAAFVEHPEDPSVRWHLGPAFEKAGFTPAPLGAFVTPGPWPQAVSSASPAEWQLGLVLASSLAALACALWLLRAYVWKSAWVNPIAIILLCLGLLLAGTSFFALRTYGPTADARAVIAWNNGTLRSIPTEADTTQKTTPLAAGSVAVVDRTFLGWIRLSFENGQTGWVRKDQVVPVWGMN